ncbi:hypothetical protein [Flavobacterium sp. W21_SRS_FM6]|uniref:hypothetical protein n=1 Tax=Flavobacterium sp. W21_SRS_FM6 TaxID=3240268 RepID=UPI003F936F76
MSNNLFISYDLHVVGQNYTAVAEAIKSLGSWAKVQQSVWYVNSAFTAAQAAKKVWGHMDNNDSLIVVDATNNDASWYNLSDEVAQHIQRNWK